MKISLLHVMGLDCYQSIRCSLLLPCDHLFRLACNSSPAAFEGIENCVELVSQDLEPTHQQHGFTVSFRRSG